jgi:hydroxyacylglutathione hydrolase
MWGSLAMLTARPDDTTVYCAHEYTASNARFALSVDDDPALKRRAEAVFAARARGEPTVPTTIGLEKATNPFLRYREPEIVHNLVAAHRLDAGADPVAAFAALREWKNTF